MSLILVGMHGSRKAYNESLKKLESKDFLNNALDLNLESIPDGDTLAYFWNNTDAIQFEPIIHKMSRKLIRSRQLEPYRLGLYYLIAIDGTELYRFNEKHCEHCLWETRNGKKQYFHRVLEAKIVTSNGLAISVATEFIENPVDKEFDKQDCELKAFYRISEKLKKTFPRLKICLLLDGLYPNASVFTICQDNYWKYIITFKEGNLKTVWEDFNGFFKNRKSAIGGKLELPEIILEDKATMYRWINQVDYQEFKLNILAKYYQDKLTRAFVTNLKINQYNFINIESHGQLRWKIENEGFDAQKHHGYNLEHLYTKVPNGMKVVYLLIQISHIINQLFFKADVLNLCYPGISMKYVITQIIKGILMGWISEYCQAFKNIENKSFQLRFNTS